MFRKHDLVTARIGTKRGHGHELGTHARLQRLDIGRAVDPDRLAATARCDKTKSDLKIRLFRALGRFNLDASRGTEPGFNAPTRLYPRLSASLRSNLATTALCVCIGLLSVGCVPSQATKPDNVADITNPMLDAAYSKDADAAFVMEPRKAVARGSGKVDFGLESASRRARDMAHWIVSSRDNRNMPFAIVDKVNAKVYVFSADGQLYGAAPVLLGLAKGDHSIPGIGNKPLSVIPPADRTTPAGRFVSTMGRNHKGKDILWLDYEQALSMHAVVKGTPRDRRAERLASPTSQDNRISFGCINVPVKFFEDVIQGNFTGAGGIVYILPEAKSVG